MGKINAGCWSVGVVAVTVAAAFAGCGSSSSSDNGAASGNTTASSSPGVQAAQKELDSFRGVPKFQAPGEAFDAKKAAAGKTILSIRERALRLARVLWP